ncbi:hypothetical protein RF11_11636 [Thelohanellus kitauei]|uniref:Uncharacterized protein n=1 Tax=Thelohanellus kitauei TaxID=669202 RepID=A0A0C2MNG3_THEKT|nr:hypothetical protein RF11_11636 [Thelohanellus kitauei]
MITSKLFTNRKLDVDLNKPSFNSFFLTTISNHNIKDISSSLISVNTLKLSAKFDHLIWSSSSGVVCLYFLDSRNIENSLWQDVLESSSRDRGNGQSFSSRRIFIIKCVIMLAIVQLLYRPIFCYSLAVGCTAYP